MKKLVLAASVACAHETAPVVPEIAIAMEAPKTTVAADPVLERMARARDLAIVHDVKRLDVDRAGLVARLEAHVAREIPREEIRAEDAFLKALGAIAPDVDYEREVYSALRDGAAGMYEPFDQTMYLAGDLSPSTLATTVAHESVHALQDQHFDLRAFQGYLRGQTDTMLARSCLAEGDATEATGEKPPTETLEDSDGLDDDYITHELAAPYVHGSAFVHALRARGGWAEVDRAWRTPLTTEQILHPDKWIAAERAESVPAPTFGSLDGFHDAFVDVKGELSLRLVFALFVGGGRAAEGASGWAGDTALLVHDGSRVALAWRIRWDDDASAASGFAIFAQGFRHRADVSVTRAGRDALVLVGPADRLARWSKEVLR